MKANLFKKFLSFSYGSWVGLLIGFITTLLTTRILSPDEFGKASMFTLVINFLVIFILFGTDQSFVRFFYEEKETKRGGLLYNSLKLPLFLTIFTVILVIIFQEKISLFLFNEINNTAILFLIIGIVVSVIYRFGSLVIRMQQKGNLYSILQILNKLFELVLLLILFFVIGHTYEIMIYSIVLTTFILMIISILTEKTFWNPLHYFESNLTHDLTEIIKYGYPLLLTLLITWLFQSFDRIAIKQWSSFGELGLYVAAFKIVALLNVIQVSFTTFWTPVCFEHYEKYPEDKKFFGDMTRTVAIVMSFISIITIAGKDIIVLLLGSEYRDAASIMPFLVFMPIMYTISETTVIGINFFKKTKWHILIAALACVVNIIGNWVLVPNYGALGASFSTAVSYIVFFSLRTHISQMYYNVNFGLRKIYSMIIIVFIYAVFSVYFNDFFINMLLGIISGIIIILIFNRDFRVVIKTVNNKWNLK